METHQKFLCVDYDTETTLKNITCLDLDSKMKSKTEYLMFNTSGRRAFVNITPNVRKVVEESKIKEGLCLVNAMHITASVFINDDESGLHEDFDIWLEKLASHSPTLRSSILCIVLWFLALVCHRYQSCSVIMLYHMFLL